MGDAEVEHLRLAGIIDQDVAGLEVAMDHALLVGVLHRIANLGQQLEARRRVERAIAGVLVQRHAADEFHGEERLAVGTHPRFIDLSDPGVLESAQDLGFVTEATEELGREQAGADHLEGDGAPRVVLFGLVHGTHATFAVPAKDAIAADMSRQGQAPCSGGGNADSGGAASGARTSGLFRKVSSLRSMSKPASYASNLSTLARRSGSPRHAASRKDSRSSSGKSAA